MVIRHCVEEWLAKNSVNAAMKYIVNLLKAVLIRNYCTIFERFVPTE